GLDRKTRRAIPWRRLVTPTASRRTSLSSVRITDASAQRQERRLLVVPPLPGLQRHPAGRIFRAQALSAAKTACIVIQDSLSRIDTSATSAALRRGTAPPTRSTQARDPFCNGVRVLVSSRGPQGEKATVPELRPA